MANSICFEDLDQELIKARAQVGASEAHGLQVGMFCGYSGLGIEKWNKVLIDSLGCTEVTSELTTMLKQIYQEILENFTAINFEFELFLPSDDFELAERVICLSDWCRGFLSGLGLVGVTKETLTSKLAEEAISDLSEIAHVQMLEEDSDEEENAYMELVEYIRVAVQTIQVELKMTYEQDGKTQLH